MSLVDVQNLSVSFSGKTIFDNVGFQLAPGNRVGLIGPNGSGKTTLLRILAGEQSSEAGDVQVAKEARIGYLKQDIEEDSSEPVLPSVIQSIEGRTKIQEALVHTEKELAATHDEDEVVKLSGKLAELHERNNHLDLRYPPYEAERILAGLGFDSVDLQKTSDQLSGGWRMRLALAKLLYQKPEILLMDEPTNHLDIPSVHWLEGFLQNYEGAIVLVCHDRDFLNRQVSRIISFEPEGVRHYSGNYDFYLTARVEERRILENKSKNQERQVREAKRFIDRFRTKATKARQAQSKIKMLDKMELIETHRDRKSIKFSFPPTEQTGRNVLHVENLKKAFDENLLFEHLNLNIQRGERIAIIGPNGSGKTTLLRIIANELKADTGSIHLGQNVSISYFAQHHSEDLVMSNTVVEEVQRAVPTQSVGYIRNVCGAFLFSGDDVDKSVGVLSGGEKARVALARTLVMKGNFMIMDEPTNHLDIESTEMLIEALKKYDGTLLFVSHNQSFVDRLSTNIWDLSAGKVATFPGSLYEYYDFIERREAEAKAQLNALVEKASKPVDSSGKTPDVVQTEEDLALSRKEQRRIEAERRQKASKVLGPIRKKLSSIEKRISELEKREQELEIALADPEIFGNTEKGGPLLAEFGDVRQKLEELMGRWEYLQEELTQKEAEL